MKKTFKIILVLLLLNSVIFSIVPKYHGARSLSLGYASTAFNFDINMLFLNPSFLASVTFSMSGYQYQQSYRSYLDFFDKLNETIAFDLENFDTLTDIDKNLAWNSIKDLYSSKVGLYGFKSQNPGFIGNGYGISISFENESVISPVNNDLLTKDVDEISSQDINSLEVDFLGLSYKKFSIGYAMNFSQDFYIGATLSYLKGNGNRFQKKLSDNKIFNNDKKIDSYVSNGWADAQGEFSKIVMDFAANMNIGQYFRAGVILKNYGNPVISFNDNEIELKQRIIAGIAFRPSNNLNFFIDMDIKKAVLIYNGEEMQPISFGIEKGFFKNKFFIRAGLLTDLASEYFIGSKSHTLYGLGLGFNMNKIIVDCGMGLDTEGKIKNIAVSGFIIIQ